MPSNSKTNHAVTITTRLLTIVLLGFSLFTCSLSGRGSTQPSQEGLGRSWQRRPKKQLCNTASEFSLRCSPLARGGDCPSPYDGWNKTMRCRSLWIGSPPFTCLLHMDWLVSTSQLLKVEELWRGATWRKRRRERRGKEQVKMRRMSLGEVGRSSVEPQFLAVCAQRNLRWVAAHSHTLGGRSMTQVQ